jgi:hypothetical protein
MADLADVTGALGASPQPPAAARQEAWNDGAGFYLTMSLVATALILLGFTPSFYLKSVIHAPPPLSILTITHGVVFTVWLAVFVAQSTLIATHQRMLHRQLGILGAILFGAMLSLGFSTAITAGRLGHTPPGAPPALAFMALPLIALTATAVLVVAALANRRRPDWHKRLMLASIFSMTGPGVHRLAVGLGFVEPAIPIVFAVGDLLLVTAIVYDVVRRRRLHPAYIAAAGVYAAVHVGVFWAFGSPAWHTFAANLAHSS